MATPDINKIAKQNPRVDLEKVRKAIATTQKAQRHGVAGEQRFEILGSSNHPVVVEDDDARPLRRANTPKRLRKKRN